jgi:protein-L-isoaspartate(D-aspartate) O-methyltransferase
MSHLVGSSGKATAIELDPDLAAPRPGQSRFICQCPGPFRGRGGRPLRCRRRYLRQCRSDPARRGLARRVVGGRSAHSATDEPGLSPQWSSGPNRATWGVFLIEHRSSEFLARLISPIAIFPCEGARDPLSEAAIAEAFKKGGREDATRLCRGDDVPEDRCRLRAPGWSDARFTTARVTIIQARAAPTSGSRSRTD